METWYAKPTEYGGQALVISELDGRCVAVAYNEKDAPLLAAAPELYNVLKELMEMRHKCFIPNDGDTWDTKAQDAIAKAEGRE